MSNRTIVSLAAGCIVAVFVCTIAYLLLHTLFLPVILPMLFAYGVAAWVRRVVAHTVVGRLGKTGEKWGSMVLALLVCIVVIGCLVGTATILAKQAQELVETTLWNRIAFPTWFTAHIPPLWQSRLETALTALLEKVAGWLGGVAGDVLSSLPGAALTIFFTIAGLFYWLADRDGITTWFSTAVEPLGNKIPSDVRQWWHTWKPLGQTLLDHGAVYVQAQVSLSAVLFPVLSVGLGIMGIRGQVAWAALITITDLLPLIGAGVVLLPWAGVLFLAGQTARGIGFSVLWALVWLLRQILEPRLTGHALGVHPYAMLIGLYTGYRLGGLVGILCAAVVLGAVGSGEKEKADPS